LGYINFWGLYYSLSLLVLPFVLLCIKWWF
jgi:hypothetical protein